MSFSPQQIVGGKYRLETHLARGGMGTVWRARHLDLGVDVALKVLRPDVVLDPRADERFRGEARAAARLKSPHVVGVHDFGVEGEAPFLVMELLEGEDLEDYLDREGALPLDVAVRFVLQACAGLTVVHQAGIVHRDLKPSNLFLARQGDEVQVKVLDFGIAKAPRADEGDATGGIVFGSPSYMSPEQARGKSVDVRSDLWALSAVFYRMITGAPPFRGESQSDIVVTLCTEDASPPSSLVPELTPAVDAFFRRALSRDREARPSTAAELGRELKLLVPGLFAPEDEEGRQRAPTPLPSAPEKPRGRADETMPLSPVVPESTPGASSSVPLPLSSDTEASAWLLGRRTALVVASGALLLLLVWWMIRRDEVTSERAREDGSSLALDAGAAPPTSKASNPTPAQGGPGEPALPIRPQATPPSEQVEGSEPPVVTPASAEPPKAKRAASASDVAVRPSPARPKPQEKPRPATDPVFGLPVEPAE